MPAAAVLDEALGPKPDSMSDEKYDVLARSKAFWNPGKTQDWQDMGVDLVIDRRERYHLYDMDGRRLIDVHLNGGTYNLGHRHPELIEVLSAGSARFDMGNHHFPAIARTALAEALADCAPAADMKYTAYGSGGGEAIDIAIKTARHAAQKKKLSPSSRRTTVTQVLPSRPATVDFQNCFCRMIPMVSLCRCRLTT